MATFLTGEPTINYIEACHLHTGVIELGCLQGYDRVRQLSRIIYVIGIVYVSQRRFPPVPLAEIPPDISLS